MSKRIIAAAIFSILTGAFASNASAVIVHSISHRSPIQEECINANPQDHKGYLECIRNKKAEQKKSSPKVILTHPDPKQPVDPNAPLPPKYQ